MHKYLFYLLVAIIPASLLADEKTTKTLDNAYINAIEKKYQLAIDKTFPILDSLQLSKIDDIVLAHQILSLSYCETGNQKKALEHLAALRAFSKTEDFRVFNPTPACKKLLDTPVDKKKK